ncbi:MAG: phosphopyruvate hydratase [Candidatus Hydrothermarchaeota archaeon]|nr:phosphopyruvate hydratase [Candidatus Hydrothermarchaeota archaeon]
MPTIIEDIKARKILDSRGNWTIEVDVATKGGFGRCAAPSGASTGEFEVVSFPENGADKALLKVEETIAPKLIGMNSKEQEVIDRTLKELDGTENFSNVGGNTAVAISLANAKAAASSCGISLYQHLGRNSTELPFPLGNVIGGGVHASNAPDIQEFLVIPVGAKNVGEALAVNSKVHKKTKEAILGKGKAALGKGDEGAWAPALKNEEALELLFKVCKDVAGETGVRIRLGVDVAASMLWDSRKRKYIYRREGKERSKESQIEHIQDLIEKYELYYVEDPMEEKDFDGFAELTKSAKCLICGDDLYATNVKRIEKGVKKRATNAVLIKPNQCGTLTDTFKAVNAAKNHNLTPVFSHRSGETTDETIAHLAVAFRCPIIKTGVVGGERIAKLNELIRINEELAGKAKMASLPLLGGTV